MHQPQTTPLPHEGVFFVVYYGYMAKVKKKRTKKYSGSDAATQRPTVTRVSAVSRSAAGQWLHEKRRTLKAIGTGAVIVIALLIIISGIISLF